MEKRIYTLITPEGREVVLGTFTSESRAKAAATRKFPADWLALCVYPLVKAKPEPGERELEGMAKRAAKYGSDFLDHDHSMDY